MRAADVAVERTLRASDRQNVHSSAVRNQMNAQLQLMKNATQGTGVSQDLAFAEIARCLQNDYNAHSAFNRNFGPAGRLLNTPVADDLVTLWNYIRSRPVQPLKRQLEASLIAKFHEIEMEGPCTVGIHQRILDVPTAIDWTFEPPPSADQLREELQRLAARISEEWDENSGQIQHFVHSEISTGNAVGNPEQILSELERDRFMQTADIEFRLLRGLPGALVKAEAERVFPAGLII